MLTSKKLQPRQLKFCQEYITDLNATQAAIRSGYSKKTAKFMASRLLTNVNVQPYIQKLMDRRSTKVEVTAENVIKELSKLAFSNMIDILNINKNTGEALIDLSNLTREQAAAIQEYTVDEYFEHDPSAPDDDKHAMRKIKKIKVKLADKRASLELLARHLKLLTDRLDINVNLNHYLHKEFETLTPDALMAEADKYRNELARHLTTSGQN